MKWLRGSSSQSCLLFAVLVLSALVTTCIAVIWILSLGAGVLALPLITAYDQPATSDESESEAAANRPAPDFTLTDLNGNRVSLSQFLGQPVVINFWATWCPPCRVEIPHLIEAYEREQGQVVFLAISLDEPESVVRSFVEEQGMPFIILLDDGGKVASTYRVNSIPVTFFISRDGEITARYVGQMSPSKIEDGLSRIR
jgi:peroxiredoxin